MELRLTSSHFLQLGREKPLVKRKMIEIFKLMPSRPTHVIDNVVSEDGFTDKDLERINVGTMQMYLKSAKGDFNELFNDVIASIEESLNPIPPITPASTTLGMPVEAVMGFTTAPIVKETIIENIVINQETTPQPQTNGKAKKGKAGK